MSLCTASCVSFNFLLSYITFHRCNLLFPMTLCFSSCSLLLGFFASLSLILSFISFILSCFPSSFSPIAFSLTSLLLNLHPSFWLILSGCLPVSPTHTAVLSWSALAALMLSLIGFLVFTLQLVLAHLCTARLYFSWTQQGTQLGGANLWTLKSNWEALFFQVWLLFWIWEGQRKLSLSGDLRSHFL